MIRLATPATQKGGPPARKREGPEHQHKSCILARLAEPGHRPMRPLVNIARIYRAAMEGQLAHITKAKLRDGRALTHFLRETLNGDGGICRELLGETPRSTDSLLRKTLEAVKLLLDDEATPLGTVMDESDAAMLSECLKEVASSIEKEINKRDIERHLDWMRGGDAPKQPWPKSTYAVPEALLEMGKGVRGGAVIGHGV